MPEKVALKDPRQFRIVGKQLTRLDTPSKVNGTAVFGIDVKLPGMLYASLEQSPVLGGKPSRASTRPKAKKMPGVIDVVQIPDGVAVVADTYWHASQGARALKVQWDEGANANLNTAAMLAGTKAAAGTGKPLVLKTVGDLDAAINAQGAKVVRGRVHLPEPVALAAGADELHRLSTRATRCDSDRPDAMARRRAGIDRQGGRPRSGDGVAADHVPRRRLRAAHRHRLHRPGGRDLQGGRASRSSCCGRVKTT